MGGNLADILSEEMYGSCLGSEKSGYGVKRSGLAGSVSTYQGNYLTFVYFKGNAFYGVDGSIIYVDIFNA